jgi:pimeloyl-ACP methyl ester carboxylesterase
MKAIATLSIQLPGLRMHALEAGPDQGPLVLLLHGFPELSESWREVMKPLAKAGFRAVAPDLRGYGETERPGSGYDLDTLADDIAQLAQQLQPGRPVHVVGHDWGGLIAYHLAATRPEVVDRLAVINAPHPAVISRDIWNPAQLARSWYAFFFQLPFLPERLLSLGGGALIPRFIRRAMVDPSRVPEGKFAPYEACFSRPEALRPPIDYYRRLFRDAFSPQGMRRMKDYPRIQAPFRLIWGEQDIALGKELTQGLAPWFTQPPEVRYLPDVGHFVPLEAPERVAALLLEHLGPVHKRRRKAPPPRAERPETSPPEHPSV